MALASNLNPAKPKALINSKTAVNSSATPSLPLTGSTRPSVALNASGSSALLLPRISIFQLPVRSIAEMAVVTVACVARQLKVTRQSQMSANMAAYRRARRVQKACTPMRSDPLARSKMAPTA